MATDFPLDATGDALRRMAAGGDDLSKPRDIDFTAVFATKLLAERFASHFQQPGHHVSIKESKCVPELPWDVVVVNHMLPSHGAIAGFEKELQEVASELGGRNDSWGCFSESD